MKLAGLCGKELFRIGVSRKDGEGAVELLGEHEAGKFMREGQRRKGKFLGGAATQCFGETFRSST